MNNKLELKNHYHLNITISEARHLEVANVNTKVIVTVGSKKKKISAKTKKTEHPYYNKRFRLSFYETLPIFLQRYLRLSVYQTKCFKLIGACDIEIVTIWDQPGHQYYQKWAMLTNPKDPISGIKGYLKCDISILVEGVPHVTPSAVISDDIEGNTLVPLGSLLRRQNALFTFNMYRADGITCKKIKCGKEVEVICKNMYVKVHFAGKTVNSKVAKNSISPIWQQALPFIESIPSLFKRITIEVWDRQNGIMVGSTFLSLSKLWNQSNIGGLPTFGPFFLYLFQEGPTKSLAGRVLLSINCTLIDSENPRNLRKIENISPLNEMTMPKYEQFTLFIAVFHCIFFTKKSFKNCDIICYHGSNFTQLQPTESQKNSTDRSIEAYQASIRLQRPIRVGKSYVARYFNRIIPTSHATSSWPSMHDRERRYNFINYLMRSIVKQILDCQQAYFLGLTEEAIQIGMKVLQQLRQACRKMTYFPPLIYESKLDQVRKVEFQELLGKADNDIYLFLKREKITCDEILAIAQKYADDIIQYTDDPQRTFPSFEIAITKVSTKQRKTQTFLKTEYYLYSPLKEESGYQCGKLSTIFIQDSGGDDVAALEALLWFGRNCDFDQCQALFRGDKMESTDQSEGMLLEERSFELRVHVYQGRLNPGSDATGLADPSVRVFASGQVRETQVKAQTLDPIWDETLVFSQITLCGNEKFIKCQSTGVIFEVLDYDGDNVTELVGRGVVRPHVNLLKDSYVVPRLKREFVQSCGEDTGEVLLAMELIEIEAQNKEEKKELTSQCKVFAIPEEIRPHFKWCLFEVMFWGIRNLKNIQLPSRKVMAQFECNGMRLESSLATAQCTFNFENQVQKINILIPEEMHYAPPLSVSLYEFNCFNKPTYKGGTIIPFITRFIAKNPKSAVDSEKIELNHSIMLKLINHDKFLQHVVELDEIPDWWTKYYASKIGEGHERILCIYGSELEKQPEFEEFQDLLFNFNIMRGKTNIRKSMANQELVANLKCGVKLITCPENQEAKVESNMYPPNDPLDVTVRVYIVAAHNLTPTDINGRCDPYISLSLGKMKITDRKSYIYKDTCPIFGKCYELKATFPWDHTLKISVMDHNICQSDNLIGQTSIDLENRYYTCHRASCGISDTYETSGYCKWRGLLNPSEILQLICRQRQMPEPLFLENHICIGNYLVYCKSERKESAALEVLRNFHKIPEYGFHLVREHIETRCLYHPKAPDVCQGKLEMWVDIFPGHCGLPPPVDITPREPQNLELRIIIWTTTDVVPSDISLLTRQKSSDIYLKAWLTSSNESQKTDIHYRSITGEGRFNWRLIFPFVYSPAEGKMILWKKKLFSEELWKEKIPCTLQIQLWDNDIIFDDYIGSLSLDLRNMPRGSNSATNCTLEMFDPNFPRSSLFKLKKMRGWWPITTKRSRSTTGKGLIVGKVDMELEILTEEEARFCPVGRGRDGPHPLPEPKRPETYSFWAVSPLSIITSLALRITTRKILIFVAIAATVMFFVAAWFALPGILLNKMFKT